MRPYPGQDWHKVRVYNNGRIMKGRLAQVSAVDSEYVYMYWPDKDTQTRNKHERLRITTEWIPASKRS